MKTAPVLLAALAIALLSSPALAGRTHSPSGAMVYIISPQDGATVSNPVTVRFGLKAMGVAPAGVEKENTGHHHLLIDVGPAAVDFESPLPADDNHLHFGGGQTETKIELPPGKHTLILLLGDHNHTPHDPSVISNPVTISVE